MNYAGTDKNRTFNIIGRIALIADGIETIKSQRKKCIKTAEEGVLIINDDKIDSILDFQLK